MALEAKKKNLCIKQHSAAIKSDTLHFNAELRSKDWQKHWGALNMYVLMRMALENNKYCHFKCKS